VVERKRKIDWLFVCASIALVVVGLAYGCVNDGQGIALFWSIAIMLLGYGLLAARVGYPEIKKLFHL
jgi:hypothetical protein